MAYKSLMKLFYMDASSDRFANNECLAAERLGADSTFRTGMHTATGELFIALPHELSVLSEQVLRKERVVQSLQTAIPPIARGALVRNPLLTSLAQKYNVSTGQICLRWCLQHGVGAVVKSTSPERRRQNADLFSFEISDEDMQKLDNMPQTGFSGLDPDHVTF